MNEFTFKNPDDETPFTSGIGFHSLDGGRTWIPGPLPPTPVALDAEVITVTGVDRERGIITATFK